MRKVVFILSIGVLAVAGISSFTGSPGLLFLRGQLAGGCSGAVATSWDKIPGFIANPTVYAVRNGSWSNPTTWSTGAVPSSVDVVCVAGGFTVTINDQGNSADSIGIDAGGKLTFDPTVNTSLEVANLIVFAAGTLEIGTPSAPISPLVTADVTIADKPLDITNDGSGVFDPAQLGTAIIALGKVTMHGAMKSPTWLRLGQEPLAGQTTLQFDSPVTGWNVGDRLFIPDTTQLKDTDKFNQNYVLKIDQPVIQSISADGKTVTITQPLLYNHRGARDADGTPTVMPSGVKLLPHVGNLTRNVKIHSKDPAGTRGHMFFTQRAEVDIRYIEVKDMGRTRNGLLNNTTYNADGSVNTIGSNQIGRYPLHMHHDWGAVNPSNTGYQFVLMGNAIADSLKWPVAIHDSHYGLIQDNVIFGGSQHTGAGIATEDGSETENLFQRNFIADITAHYEPRNSLDALSPGVGAECFWNRSKNNIFVGNVAANCRNTRQQIVSGVGFKFGDLPGGSFARQPLHRGADLVNGVSGTDWVNMNVQMQPIRQFEDNEVYGATADGLTIWDLGKPYALPSVLVTMGETLIKNLTVWNTYEAGVFNYPSNHVTIDGLFFRVDPTFPSAPNGFSLGDYHNVDLTIRNANVHANSLISYVKALQGVIRLENNFTITKNYALDIYTPSTDGTKAKVYKTLYIAKNNDFRAWPNQALRSMNLRNAAGSWTYITIPTSVVVCDYQRQPGNNFQAYRLDQAPDSILRPYTYYGYDSNGDGQVDWLMDEGCPETGLTNAECDAKYGIKTANEIAACADTTTRPEVLGFTCQTAFADAVCAGNEPPIDLTNPTVSVQWPTANMVLTGPVVFSATASDNDKVRYVSFRINGGGVGPVDYTPLDGFTLAYPTTLMPDGTYTITAAATDVTGNVSVSAPVRVTFNNGGGSSSASSASSAQSSSAQSSFAQSSSQSSASGGGGSVSLLAQWRFDEGSGVIAVDSTGNGNDGSLTNSPTWTTGKLGGGLQFDGVNDFVDLSAHAANLAPNQPASISFWVNSVSDTVQPIFSGEPAAGSTNLVEIAIGNGATGMCTNELITVVRNVGGVQHRLCYVTDIRTELFDGNWHLVTVTFSGLPGRTKMYVDGVQKSVTVGGGSNNGQLFDGISGITRVRLGQSTALNWFARGTADDVCLWSGELSLSDIASLFNGGQGNTCDVLGGGGGGSSSSSAASSSSSMASSSSVASSVSSSSSSTFSSSASSVFSSSSVASSSSSSQSGGGSGYAPVFSTYMGGASEDTTRDVTSDAQGNVYVTGGTASTGLTATQGAYDTTYNGVHDIYVAKYSPTGQLLCRTFLGGPNYDRAYGIELDPQGNIVIAGRAGQGFPTTSGVFQPTFGGDSTPNGLYGAQDGFIAKLTNDCSQLLWATYIGGNDASFIRDVAVDAQGAVYPVMTIVRQANPHITSGAFQTSLGGADDGLIAKISPDGQRVVWASYFGGTGDDMDVPSIRVDSLGEPVVLGATTSTDAPTTVGAYDTTPNGGSDFMLVKFKADGSGLVFSTYFGGNNNETMETHELGMDAQGNSIIAAGTRSTNFPVTPGAFQQSFAGAGGAGTGQGTNYPGDGIVAKFSPAGDLLASTYIGGMYGENIEGVGTDSQGNIYVSGATYSPDFPVTSDAFQPTKAGSADFFAAKLSSDLTTLLYGTFFGGNGTDYGRTAHADSSGNFYIAGMTNSTNWPVVNPAQPTLGGGNDGTVVKFAFGGSNSSNSSSSLQQSSSSSAAPSNQPPSANAGIDQTINLPNSTQLQGGATDDGLPNPPSMLTYQWSDTQNTGDVTFADATDPQTIVSFTAPGTYILQLSVSDSDLSDADTVTITARDITSPVISGIQSDATVTSATITWVTDEPSTSQVEYGRTQSYGSSTPRDSALVRNHTVVLNNLTANALYHFRVISSDISGNTSASADQSFSTLAPPPADVALCLSAPFEGRPLHMRNSSKVLVRIYRQGQVVFQVVAAADRQGMVILNDQAIADLPSVPEYTVSVKPVGYLALSRPNLNVPDLQGKPCTDIPGSLTPSAQRFQFGDFDWDGRVTQTDVLLAVLQRQNKYFVEGIVQYFGAKTPFDILTNAIRNARQGKTDQ